MSNILFLSTSPEMLDENHGGRQRSNNLVKALSKEHSVTVLALSWQNISFDKKINNKLRFISIPVEQNVVRASKQNKPGLTNYSPDVMIDFYHRYMREYRSTLTTLVKRSDLVVVDHYSIIPMIEYIESDIPIFYSSHNCETDLALQLYESDTVDVKTINKMEREIIKKCSAFSYCSTDDINQMQQYFYIDKPNYYIPNGTDIPENIIAGSNFDKKDILFVGSGHPPNWDAVKKIIDIAYKTPEYNYVIAGTASYIIDKWQLKLPKNVKRYDYISNDQVDKLFSEAFAFINPVEKGSGTHLKIIKALGYGLPTITSAVGARGHSDEDKANSMLIANTEDEIIDKIKSLSDKNKYEKISKNAIELAKKYNWDNIKIDFLNAINKTIKGVKFEQKPMESKNILVYSIMRNEGIYIDNYHKQLKQMVEAYPEHTFYLSIYENDSEDDTKKKLQSKDWSFFKDVSIVHETLKTKFYGSVKDEDRVRNLAIARNKAIEAKDFLSKCDYVMMIEGDVTYDFATVDQILRFTEREPDFDVVSGMTIRSRRLYDVWATRTGPKYNRGVLPLYEDYELKHYDKYYATSNGICLYRVEPFKKGVRYHWINSFTNEYDCEMVVVCQKFHEIGYSNIYIIYDAKIYHEHF